MTTTEASFWERVEPTGFCWNWIGHTTRGYGRLTIDGRLVLAHRLSYELLVGDIPTGLVIDHLCRNKLCVNPDHLEPVTLGENTRRGFWSVRRGPAQKDQCPYGHDYAVVGKYKRCHECQRIRTHRRRGRNCTFESPCHTNGGTK